MWFPSNFVSDPVVPNRLIDMYFDSENKIRREKLIRVFSDENLVNGADLFKIAMLYFINTFLLPSGPKKSLVPKLYFDLVERGEYRNFPWGNKCFQKLLAACIHKLRKKPLCFTFGGFHLALQIWIYECCLNVDSLVTTL